MLRTVSRKDRSSPPDTNTLPSAPPWNPSSNLTQGVTHGIQEIHLVSGSGTCRVNSSEPCDRQPVCDPARDTSAKPERATSARDAPAKPERAASARDAPAEPERNASARDTSAEPERLDKGSSRVESREERDFLLPARFMLGFSASYRTILLWQL